MTLETFLWGDNEGYEYRTFDRLRLDFNFVETVRDIMTLISLFLVIWAWVVNGLDTYLYLTFWGIHLTWLAMYLNRQASFDQQKNPGKTEGLMFLRWRSAVIFFQTALSLELVITPLYFVLLWETPEDGWTLDDYRVFANHSVPIAILLIDFFMQKWIFRFNHVWIPVLFVLLYGLVNFSHVRIFNFLPYTFLTWDDTYSYVIMLIALVATFLFHTLFYLVSRLNRVTKLYIPIYDPSIMYVMV
jgi:hypothetical protein